MEWNPGDLIWFDPGVGNWLPGEVLENHKTAQILTVQAVINNKPQTFALTSNDHTIQKRQDLGLNGLEDMTQLADLHEAALLWNLKLRYDHNLIYTYVGSILIALNPYKTIDSSYDVESAQKYKGKLLGDLPPHLFALSSSVFDSLPQPQVVVINGESGSGKTECSKLVLQYLAAVAPLKNQSLVTEQILEATPLLEAFGNAQTTQNDNSSRFGKYLEIYFKDSSITGAKLTQYLLEKSRIVTQAPNERNYHVFYELLDGLGNEERQKYGLVEAEKYFYLNQGGGDCGSIRTGSGADWNGLVRAMEVLGVQERERDGIVKVLASILHLGNVYFHRRQLRHGQEGVEIGSDVEIKWTSHLLEISTSGLQKALTTRITDTQLDKIHSPLSIDQALDTRDAFAKALYSCLFNWLVQRINMITFKEVKRTVTDVKNIHHNRQSFKSEQETSKICLLDIFGFENLPENSFEQLCINFASESLQHYFNKYVFKLEQLEYVREKLKWTNLTYPDNSNVLNLLGKKPVGILHLLDDESNFPKASDSSFLEKCHYNHVLNENYSRPRLSLKEFGIKHYAGQVWYSTEGFLDKNRDFLRPEIINLLTSSKEPLVKAISQPLLNQIHSKTLPRGQNGRFVTIKPRTPTISARFNDSLQKLLESMSKCNPWFIRCIKPNNDKIPMKFDLDVVLEQLKNTGMVEMIRIRRLGYPKRMKFYDFVEKFGCLFRKKIPKHVSYRDFTLIILKEVLKNDFNNQNFFNLNEQNDINDKNDKNDEEVNFKFQLGVTKIFLNENLSRKLEIELSNKLRSSAMIIQKNYRGFLARKEFDRKKKATLVIQKSFRGYVQRKRFKTVKNGVVKCQALVRMRIERKKYLKLLKEFKRAKERMEISKNLDQINQMSQMNQINQMSQINQMNQQQNRNQIYNQNRVKDIHQNYQINHQNLSQVNVSQHNLNLQQNLNQNQHNNQNLHQNQSLHHNNQNQHQNLHQNQHLNQHNNQNQHQNQISHQIYHQNPSQINAKLNHLEIPAELAFIFTKLETFTPQHSEKNLIKLLGGVKGTLKSQSLPKDLDSFEFSKFTSVYFNKTRLEAKKEPILTPFLTKSASKDQDFQDSLAVFKLILRWVNDQQLTGLKEKVLGDFICFKGLNSKSLRDEIFVQIINQTFSNDKNNEDRLWCLLSICLSSFQPSPALNKYLLKYIKDNAPEPFKTTLEQKLMRSIQKAPHSRVFPPSLLEWKSIKQKINTALPLTLPDGSVLTVSVDSWTSCEDAASVGIKSMESQNVKEKDNFMNLDGWTVTLDDSGIVTDGNGLDYIFDLVSELELCPAFPVQRSTLFKSGVRNKNEVRNKTDIWNKSEVRIDQYREDSHEKMDNYQSKDHFQSRKLSQDKFQDKYQDEFSKNFKTKSFIEKNYSDSRIEMESFDSNNFQLHRKHSQEETDRFKSDKSQFKSRSYLIESKIDEFQDNLSKNQENISQQQQQKNKTPKVSLIHNKNQQKSPFKINPSQIKSNQGDLDHVLNVPLIRPQIPPPEPPQGLRKQSRDLPTTSRRISNQSERSRHVTDEEIDFEEEQNDYRSRLRVRSSFEEVSESFNRHNDEIQTDFDLESELKGESNQILSRNSALNERYFELEKVRSRSLDNLLSEPEPTTNLSDLGLSQSRLNDRYHSVEHLTPIKPILTNTITKPELDFEYPDISSVSTSNRGHPRYIKSQFSGKKAPTGSYQSSRAYIEKNEYNSVSNLRSSAMSDTSEAPSLASHVRRVRVPSQASDVDQFLDELFSPVLDGNLDELSDARSLAASIKGGLQFGGNKKITLSQINERNTDPKVIDKVKWGFEEYLNDLGWADDDDEASEVNPELLFNGGFNWNK